MVALVHYKRQRPDRTTLHRLVSSTPRPSFAQAAAATAANLPQFVKDEFDAFLECATSWPTAHTSTHRHSSGPVLWAAGTGCPQDS